MKQIDERKKRSKGLVPKCTGIIAETALLNFPTVSLFYLYHGIALSEHINEYQFERFFQLSFPRSSLKTNFDQRHLNKYAVRQFPGKLSDIIHDIHLRRRATGYYHPFNKFLKDDYAPGIINMPFFTRRDNSFSERILATDMRRPKAY